MAEKGDIQQVKTWLEGYPPFFQNGRKKEYILQVFYKEGHFKVCC